MKSLVIIICIGLIMSCAVNKMAKQQSIIRMLDKDVYYSITGVEKSDSVFFTFYDSGKTVLDTGRIKGLLTMKFKSGEVSTFSLDPLSQHKFFAFVPDWTEYDTAELTVVIHNEIKKATFYNERETWNKKEPLVAPWRKQF